MASSSQSLTTNIIINAKAGSGFDTVASTLNQMSEMVSGITQSLFGFGKDSVDVYKTYEKAMAEVEGALATQYGRGSNQLSRYMDSLNEKAAEWASTTIFHTDDVANAMVEAARSGWDYDQILAGIPASMELAQAGGLDLTQAVDYVVKASNAGGVAFENMGTFIDHWAYAANSSATNIEELGDAMLRMGKTMSFTSSQDELLTMLAVLADNGYTGAEAGTLLRNTMLRLIAPTDKAKQAMESLGLTSEEVNEAIGGADIESATAALEAHGFSAYNAAGQLKPMTEIFKDLNTAISGMENDAERMDVLGAIFPTRTITGALSLLGELGTEGQALIDRMNQGEAEGYAEYLANLNMDTVYGDLETMYSKLEEMKRMVGETLAGDVRDVVSSISGLVNNINGLDTSTFSALVGGLEGMAASGGVVMGAASGINLLKTAVGGWPVLGFAAAATGIGFLAGALHQLADVNYEEAFGVMKIDPAEITSRINEINAAFEADYSKVTEFREELAATVTDYEEQTSNLSATLTAKMIAGHKFDPNELTQISESTKVIGQQLIAGIEQGYNETFESLALSQGIAEGEESNPIWNQIIETLEYGHDKAVAKAEQLGKDLSEAINTYLKVQTPDALADVMEIFDQMDALLEKQMTIDREGKVSRFLYDAQTMGWETIEENMSALSEAQHETMLSLAEKQGRERGEIIADYDQAMEDGLVLESLGRVPTTMDKQNALDLLGEAHAAEIAKYTADYTLAQARMVEGAMLGEGFKDGWDAIKELGSAYRTNGGLTTDEFERLVTTIDENNGNYERALDDFVSWMGGTEQILANADYFRQQGDLNSADLLTGIVDAYSVRTPAGVLDSTDTNRAKSDDLKAADLQTSLQAMNISVGELASAIKYSNANNEDLGNVLTDITGAGVMENPITLDNYNSLLGMAAERGYADITGWFDAAKETLISMGEYTPPQPAQQETVTEIQTYTQGAAQPAMETQTFTATLDTAEAEGAIDSLSGQSVDLDVNAETGAAEGAIQGLDGQNLMEFVDGDISALSGAIDTQDGRHITVSVGGNTASLASAINSYANRTITVNVRANKIGFATGGRATEASIFGEAGPEWAIPEEHTENTAMLLNAAREASGFTWPEILQRFGGLNANANNAPSTLIYSPTINAADANGVDEVLRADKERLEKWFEDKKLHDSVEVYQ